MEEAHVLDSVSIIQISSNLNLIISILCSIIQHHHHHHQDNPNILHNPIKDLEDLEDNYVLDMVSFIQMHPNLYHFISILCSIIQHHQHHNQDDPTSSTTPSRMRRTPMFLTGFPSLKYFQICTRSSPYYALSFNIINSTIRMTPRPPQPHPG